MNIQIGEEIYKKKLCLFEYIDKCINKNCKDAHIDESYYELSENTIKLKEINYEKFLEIESKKKELKEISEYISDWSSLEDDIAKKVEEMDHLQKKIPLLEKDFLNEDKNEDMVDVPNINIKVNGIDIEDNENILNIFMDEKNSKNFENEIERLIKNIKCNIIKENINEYFKIKSILHLNKILFRIKLFNINYSDILNKNYS